jgi:hypothetical protein
MKNMGPVSVSQAVGGFSNLTWLAIGNSVMSDLLSQKFNWKWNSFNIPPFYTIGYQTDYATISQKGIGWLENATWVDINNTALPKPEWTVEAVRALQPTSFAASPPTKLCWMYNKTLKQASWPGAGVVYINPLGQVSTPANPRTNILDANGNILIVTTYGTTGNIAPVLPAATAPGTTVIDGNVVWTCCDPDAQGFRLIPMPPQSGVVYKIEPVGQKNPPQFISLSQKLDPIPDDYSTNFTNGVYVYCHKYAVDPQLKKEWFAMRQTWLDDILATMKQGDREEDNAGFVPSRSVMASGDCGDVGPANPYGNGWPGWSGR